MRKSGVRSCVLLPWSQIKQLEILICWTPQEGLIHHGVCGDDRTNFTLHPLCAVGSLCCLLLQLVRTPKTGHNFPLLFWYGLSWKGLVQRARTCYIYPIGSSCFLLRGCKYHSRGLVYSWIASGRPLFDWFKINWPIWRPLKRFWQLRLRNNCIVGSLAWSVADRVIYAHVLWKNKPGSRQDTEAQLGEIRPE